MLSGSARRRLAEELEEDGIKLEEGAGVRELLLDELDYAQRIPMFEGRRPLYGSFSMPPGEATGARIVQRTLVFGQVRLITERRVISSDGQSWTDRPTAAALLAALRQCAPELDPRVAHGLLDLAVHWLSPARVGATIVVHEQGFDWASMDVATKFRAPKLSIKIRQHFPALFASLQQHDLATLVSADGSVEYLGVGLRSTVEAEQNVDSSRGMCHRSAQRFSFDHPSTTIAVVSDNGPVTIFRNGLAVGLTAAP